MKELSARQFVKKNGQNLTTSMPTVTDNHSLFLHYQAYSVKYFLVHNFPLQLRHGLLQKRWLEMENIGLNHCLSQSL